jgi:hypothetical protein
VTERAPAAFTRLQSAGTMTPMTHFPPDREIERGFREWKALMDFGMEFALAVHAQNHPGSDPLAALRAAWQRKGDEHTLANERMMRRLAGER